MSAKFHYLIPHLLVTSYGKGVSMDTRAILIVEKEYIIAADIDSCLKRMGFQVTETVSTIEEAFETAKRVCPQLAVFNLNVAGKLSGIQAVKIIHELFDRIPILFLDCDPKTRRTIDQSNFNGPYGYLQMPFLRDILEAEVEKLLKLHKSYDTI